MKAVAVIGRHRFAKPAALRSTALAAGLSILAALSGCSESLHDVAARGDLEAVAELVELDPEWVDRLDDRGKSPLFHAVTNNRTEIVVFLLDHGAEPGLQDATGLTPLHIAVWHGRSEPAKVLAERGADVHARDVFGDTPLHTAAMHGRADMVEWLLSVGADAGLQNDAGLTPAALARQHRQTATADLLDALPANSR